MVWTVYPAGAALGAAAGIAAAVLAVRSVEIPPARRKLCLSVCAGFGLLAGLYEVWLYNALDQNFWGLLLLWSCALCAAVTDLTDRSISPAAMGIYAAALAVYRLSSLPSVTNALLGAAAGAAVLGIPYLLRPQEVGRGDILLLAVCGLGAGFPGVIYILARSLLLLALVSIVQLLRKKVEAKSEMPLAPFLLFGILI